MKTQKTRQGRAKQPERVTSRIPDMESSEERKERLRKIREKRSRP